MKHIDWKKAASDVADAIAPQRTVLRYWKERAALAEKRVADLEREKDELIELCHPEFGTLWREIGELREQLDAANQDLARMQEVYEKF